MERTSESTVLHGIGGVQNLLNDGMPELGARVLHAVCQKFWGRFAGVWTLSGTAPPGAAAVFVTNFKRDVILSKQQGR
jgi:hypothetical protein